MIDRIADFQWRGSPQAKYWMRETAFQLEESPSFHVVATKEGAVVGHLFCMRNDDDSKFWYYGDLAVKEEFRRCGIAQEMIRTALWKILEFDGERVCCFVEKDNVASIALQRKMGFVERPAVPFGLLDTEDQLMFVRDLQKSYEILALDEYGAFFPTVLYRRNREILHGEEIRRTDFQKMLAANDPDEVNVLICDRGAPRAWLKLNGLEDAERGWISMLVVAPRHFREGVGTFAVRYAEEYLGRKGKSVIAIHTTADNLPAAALYRKCGYTLVGKRIQRYGDGTEQTEITFEKSLVPPQKGANP